MAWFLAPQLAKAQLARSLPKRFPGVVAPAKLAVSDEELLPVLAGLRRDLSAGRGSSRALCSKRTFTARTTAICPIPSSQARRGPSLQRRVLFGQGALLGQHRGDFYPYALYAQSDKFLAWSDKAHGRLINIYTDQGGTRAQTEEMMTTFKQRGTPFFSGNEGEATLADLRTNRLVFLFTGLPHDEVLNKHHTFRDLLSTSCLAEIRVGL